jgi:hypothetical protein
MDGTREECTQLFAVDRDQAAGGQKRGSTTTPWAGAAAFQLAVGWGRPVAALTGGGEREVLRRYCAPPTHRPLPGTSPQWVCRLRSRCSLLPAAGRGCCRLATVDAAD